MVKATCFRCQEDFEDRQLADETREGLRKALLVISDDYDPVICDPCVGNILGNVGHFGVKNYLLRVT